MGVAAAVTETCSVSAPIEREIFPRSRTSFAVTSILDCGVGLEAGGGLDGQAVSRGHQAVEAEEPFRSGSSG